MKQNQLLSVIILGIVLLSFTGCSEQTLPVSAHQESGRDDTTSLAKNTAAFPYKIPLPNGFQPEGIATGMGTNLSCVHSGIHSST